MLDIYREYLRYDAESGKFFWIKRPSNRVSVGDEAGSVNCAGYKMIRLNGRICMAHRIAWMMIYGRAPGGEIDHINGVKSDNRISNLRVVDRSKQLMNTRIRSDNKSGVKGVRYDADRKSWSAYIKAYGTIKQVRAKSFDEAVAIRRNLEAQLHGEYARKAV